MAAFQTPVDVGNRAAQHCGAEMMDPVLGFTENSKVASQISFVYDKLRVAELQRRTWTFATRRQVLRAIDTNTMLLQPSLWAPGTTYFAGSIVSDGSGTNWISNAPNNLGNQPQNSTLWDPYFGPVSVSLYDASGSTAYFAGELVYTAAGDGTNRVYLSRINGNADVPATATAYSATTTYFQNQVVTFNSVAYMSLINLNIGNEPDLAPAAWSGSTTYSIGQKVYNPVDGLVYTSTANSNLNHNPATDGGVHWSTAGVLCPWTSVFVGGFGSLNWLQIGGAEFPFGVGLSTLNIVYPLGVGPSSQSITANAFRLPAGFLRLCSQNQKDPINNLGGPSGNAYNDWLVEGPYLISSDTGPLPVRFVANVSNVAHMHTMFCEGLAARVGMEVCEPLTQLSAKIQIITKIYDRWITEAGMVDAIEDGYTDPPEDELISCRY